MEMIIVKKDMGKIMLNYLHCLRWVEEFGNKYGDEDVLPIFEKDIQKIKTLKKVKTINKEKNNLKGLK